VLSALSVLWILVKVWALSGPSKPLKSKESQPPEQKHASSQKHRYSRTHWHAPRALFPRSVRFIDNTRPPAHTLLLIAAKWAWAWYLHIARVWLGAYILFTAWDCRLHNLPIYVNCRRPQAPPFPFGPFQTPHQLLNSAANYAHAHGQHINTYEHTIAVKKVPLRI